MVSSEEMIELARPGDTITVKRVGYFEQTITITAFGDRNPHIELAPESFTLSLSVVPSDSEVSIDSIPMAADAGSYALTYGNHTLSIEKTGYEPVSREFFISEDVGLEIRLLPGGSRHEFLARIESGSWPKQVVFSRDSERLYVPLLKDVGVNVIDVKSYRVELLRFSDQDRSVAFSKGGVYVGFTEGIFNSAGDRFLVSQMTTAQVHVVAYPENTIHTSFSTGGAWSKALTFSPDETYLAVSNWSSNDISILDADTFELIRTERFDAETPRGIAFTPDGSLLFIAYFGSGHVIAVSTETWLPVRSFHTGGTNRDVVIDKQGSYAYVSNMQYGVVYVIDIDKYEIVSAIRVGLKPNTIRLTLDNRHLYVSCRGPNNPEDYELPSPEDGNIYVIETESHEVVEIIPGGNQPTGLDISPDGSLLAFSNFQDNTVEFYSISDRL